MECVAWLKIIEVCMLPFSKIVLLFALKYFPWLKRDVDSIHHKCLFESSDLFQFHLFILHAVFMLLVGLICLI